LQKPPCFYQTGMIQRTNFLWFMLLILWGGTGVFAGTERIVLSSKEGGIPLEGGIEVMADSWEGTRLVFRFDGLDVREIKTRYGTFTDLALPMAFSVGEPGTPKLPASKQLIEVPFGADVTVEVLSYSTETFSLEDLGIQHPLYPVQPSMAKTEEPAGIPFFFEEHAYEKAGFIQPELAEIEVLGVMRGIRIARLTVAPVSYDPVGQTIRVYNNIEVAIHYQQPDKGLSGQIKVSTYSPFFEGLYQQVLNPSTSPLKSFPDLVKHPIKMLIVSHPDFRETLIPFIEWQVQKGFEVKVAYTNEIGGTPGSIRQYTRQQYLSAGPDNPAPTFLVLVGDTDKLPPSATGSATGMPTDLYYASVDGDYFPEMYYGRLSARNTEELGNQIDKILAYQKYDFEDPSFLNNATLIAGHDFTWNQPILQPTVKYASRNYFNEDNGFENVHAILSSYDNVYAADKVSAGIVTFTGHCTPTSWASPTLTTTGVHNLGNIGQYPLVIGNCCQSALFNQAESMAEAWVRAKNKGAVAYIGSAPDTHWYEDFYWSVGAFPMQGNNEGFVPDPAESSVGAMDALFSNEYLPVAALKMFGNLAVTQAHVLNYQTQANIPWYWQGYHTFGDPSTLIYLTEATPNSVWHMPFIPMGHDHFEVQALPGSYVAISSFGVLHGAGFTDASGKVELPIKPFTTTGHARIVITKPQHITHIEDVPVSVLEGPYIQLENQLFFDLLGNLRQHALYGEDLTVDLYLKNIGTGPAGPLSAKLSSLDAHIGLADGSQEIHFEGMGHEAPENTVRVGEAFTLRASHSIPSLHTTRFLLDVTDGNATWQSSFVIPGLSPVFDIDRSYSLTEAPGQKSMTQIDPDASALLGFPLANTGSARARSPLATLQVNSPYLSVENTEISLPPLESQSQTQVVFNVTAHPSAPIGSAIPLKLTVQDGHVASVDTSIFIGQPPEAIIGADDFFSNQYPFYNLYKANRSQMLYFAGEIGPREQIINTLGFFLLQTTASQNILPNFRIRIKHTNLSELPASFVPMDDGQEVYSSGAYQMPSSLGWHTWDISDFHFDGQSNVIVEISWGMLPDWTSPYFRVACTPSNKDLVSYGFSDLVAYPGFNGNATARPNLYLGFALPASPTPQPVTFVVNDWENPELENLSIRIGSTTLNPEHGTKTMELVPGSYLYQVFSGNGEVLRQGSFDLGNQPKTVEIYITGAFEATFIVSDQHGEELPDAMITFDGNPFDPGEYRISGLPPGEYPFVVSHAQFFDFHGTLEILDEDREVIVQMVPDNTGLPDTTGESPLDVFPNPAREYLDIRLHLPGQQAGIQLLNQHGTAVLQRTLDPEPGVTALRIPLGGLPAGIYYLRVTSGGAVYIEKVMIY
jgi:hypothetical protein